jgi:hypothetical protein
VAAGGPPPTPARLLRGPGPALPHRAQPGATDLVVYRAAIHPATSRALELRSVAVTARGTLVDYEDVDFVTLVLDTDRDGRHAGSDRVVGPPDTFVDDDGDVTWSGLGLPFGTDGQPLNLLLVVDLAAETEGGTLALSLGRDAIEVIEVSSEAVVPVKGAPLHGTLLTVEGNLEPDLEQERLDRLAAAGPDAVDEELEAETRLGLEESQQPDEPTPDAPEPPPADEETPRDGSER